MTEETEPTAKAGAVIIPVTPFQQKLQSSSGARPPKRPRHRPGGDLPKILAAIEEAKVIVEQIWLTHGHIDHVAAP